MKTKPKDDNYLELWMYLRDKAIYVKGVMFNTITWIIGFAAGLIGFTFLTLTDFDPCKSVLPMSLLLKIISFGGFLLCGYAIITIRHSRKLILIYWKDAECCEKEIDGLIQVITPISQKKIEIWDQLMIVVLFFLVAFICIFMWSLFI